MVSCTYLSSRTKSLSMLNILFISSYFSIMIATIASFVDMLVLLSTDLLVKGSLMSYFLVLKKLFVRKKFPFNFSRKHEL